MEVLKIARTKSTPEILFDPASNKLRIEGQSYPENAFKFYEPVLQWLDQFLQQTKEPIFLEIYFNMPYINTSSAKCIMMFLGKLETAYQAGSRVLIRWYYERENEMARECAEEFKEDLTVPFEITPVEPDP